MHNVLYGFVEDETQFGMSRGANTSLALDKSKSWVAIHSNSNTTSKHASQVEIFFYFFYVKQPMGWDMIGNQLVTRSLIELIKDSTLNKCGGRDWSNASSGGSITISSCGI